jgi:hypothetical protein
MLIVEWDLATLLGAVPLALGGAVLAPISLAKESDGSRC